MTIAKKIISYFLIFLVLLFTLVAVLGIWEIIDLEKVLIKVISSLIVVFASSAIVLFIFTVLVRDDKKED